jgi:hypothetical protein
MGTAEPADATAQPPSEAMGTAGPADATAVSAAAIRTAEPAATASDGRAAAERAAMRRLYERLRKSGYSLERILRATTRCNVPALARKFLTARRWREDAAYDMLAAHLDWRRTAGADTCLNERYDDRIYSAIRRYTPCGWCGRDREGRLLYVERSGLVSVTSLLKVTCEREMLEVHIQNQEYQNRFLLLGEDTPPSDGTFADDDLVLDPAERDAIAAGEDEYGVLFRRAQAMPHGDAVPGACLIIDAK